MLGTLVSPFRVTTDHFSRLNGSGYDVLARGDSCGDHAALNLSESKGYGAEVVQTPEGCHIDSFSDGSVAERCEEAVVERSWR